MIFSHQGDLEQRAELVERLILVRWLSRKAEGSINKLDNPGHESRAARIDSRDFLEDPLLDEVFQD